MTTRAYVQGTGTSLGSRSTGAEEMSKYRTIGMVGSQYNIIIMNIEHKPETRKTGN